MSAVCCTGSRPEGGGHPPTTSPPNLSCPDVLVNNVGTNIRKSTLDYTPADFERMIAVNLESAFALSQAVHPFMKAAGGGVIIMISSVAGGPVAMKSGAVYGLTKASLNQIVMNFACEWASDGIRAISVAPW